MLKATRMAHIDKQEWAQAADNAKEAATAVGETASHAASAVGAMATQAARDVGQKADDMTATAGVGIQGLGDRLNKHAQQAGVLGNASQAVARVVHDGGEYLKRAKLSGLTERVANLIRQNPLSAVVIGIGLGWVAGRQLKS
ncbi:MAG: hypothetical protein ACYC3X_17705 [Pirellulaceae bacterium]